jgi:hypothetical protein
LGEEVEKREKKKHKRESIFGRERKKELKALF